MKPDFKVSDFFSRGDYAQLREDRPADLFSKYEQPYMGLMSISYKTQWGETHDTHRGFVCEVERVDDNNGCLLLVKRDNPARGFWVCFDWVTKSSKEDAKRINSQLKAKVESDRQIDGADRRRDLNLMMAFRGSVPESHWAAGDTVEVILQGHVREGESAQIVRKEFDGTWTLDFGSLGHGSGWHSKNLKWVKC